MLIEKAREIEPFPVEDFDIVNMTIKADGSEFEKLSDGTWIELMDDYDGDVRYVVDGCLVSERPMMRPVYVLDGTRWLRIEDGEPVDEPGSSEVSAAMAAEMLGVNKARVCRLCSEGALSAKKIGNAWVIDRASVEARIASVPKAGRPRKSDAR